jgi:putative endonuclease
MSVRGREAVLRVLGLLWRRSRRDPLGPRGEREAVRLLRRGGYRVIARNVRVPMGEADIVAMAPDRRTWVVVEVKTRRVGDDGRPASAEHRPPEMSVHAEKRRKLVAITRHLARANRWKAVRIDVVAVDWPGEGKPVLRHHVGAVGVQNAERGR